MINIWYTVSLYQNCPYIYCCLVGRPRQSSANHSHSFMHSSSDRNSLTLPQRRYFSHALACTFRLIIMDHCLRYCQYNDAMSGSLRLRGQSDGLAFFTRPRLQLRCAVRVWEQLPSSHRSITPSDVSRSSIQLYLSRNAGSAVYQIEQLGRWTRWRQI